MLFRDNPVLTRELLVKRLYGVVNSADHLNFGMVLKVTKSEELVAIDFETPAPPSHATPKED